VHAPASRAPDPLTLHHTPFRVTFPFYHSSESEAGPAGMSRGARSTSSSSSPPHVLLDPAGLEKRLAHGTLTLALTPQRELAAVHNAGGLPLAPEVLMGAVQVATRRANEFKT